MLKDLVNSGSERYFGLCAVAALKVLLWNNAPRPSKFERFYPLRVQNPLFFTPDSG
jgi:hypothetical protein